MTERFVIGVVGLPFGLDGRVKVRSLSGEDEHLLRLKKAVLCKNGEEKEYTVEEAFPRPLSLKFAGIDSPEAAKALGGREIIAGREDAAPLREGEFYIEDLKGLTVYAAKTEPERKSAAEQTPEREIVGQISDVVEGGGSFLTEITLVSGEKRLVPFRNEFFGPIDLDLGRAELLVRWILE
ncbi:MAG: ribosome maturation factor RimM [Treponema sp.]|jgi:16S rRNA processing protein RimM|nr:ribosome maturation factor RimM [Treponema sp.]